MRKKWLREKTTDQLIMYREMTMIDIAAAKERGRSGLSEMLEAQIKEVDLILKERS